MLYNHILNPFWSMELDTCGDIPAFQSRSVPPCLGSSNGNPNFSHPENDPWPLSMNEFCPEIMYDGVDGCCENIGCCCCGGTLTGGGTV